MADATLLIPRPHPEIKPLAYRLGLCQTRLQRLAVTGRSAAVRDAATAAANHVEFLIANQSHMKIGVVRSTVRATTSAEVCFFCYIGSYFALALDRPRNGDPTGLDWIGHANMLEHAALVAREYLPEFHRELYRHADAYLGNLFPLGLDSGAN